MIYPSWDSFGRITGRICSCCFVIYIGPPWCEDCEGFGEPLEEEAA